jgi:hypothetical protein
MYLKLHYDQSFATSQHNNYFRLWMVNGTEVESSAKIGNKILSHIDFTPQ